MQYYICRISVGRTYLIIVYLARNRPESFVLFYRITTTYIYDYEGYNNLQNRIIQHALFQTLPFPAIKKIKRRTQRVYNMNNKRRGKQKNNKQTNESSILRFNFIIISIVLAHIRVHTYVHVPIRITVVVVVVGFPSYRIHTCIAFVRYNTPYYIFMLSVSKTIVTA